MDDLLNNHTSSTWQSELKAIIAGLISGGKYGMKIRLPHAAVMTLLFRGNASAREKLKLILQSSWEHSRNLASFAATYKTILFLLKWISIRLRSHPDHERRYVLERIGRYMLRIIVDGPSSFNDPTTVTSTLSFSPSTSSTPGYAQNTQHAAIAGAIGGYMVWGNYSSINYQIVLYLTSRILTGLVSLAREKEIPPFHWKVLHFRNVYPIQAAVVWGTVMALFETYPHVLHPSLKKSMDEVYRS